MVNGGIGVRHLHLPFCLTPARFALAWGQKKLFALSAHVGSCGREVAQDHVRLKQMYKPLKFGGNIEMLKYAGCRAHHVELYWASLIEVSND